MSLTTDQARNIAGAGGNVVTTGGEKIGSIGQIYLDDATGEPSWITVKTGLFGTKESFVPLEGANVSGDDVTVGFDKAKITDAPKVDPDGSLSPAEEDQLYDYYGLGGGTADSGTGFADTTTNGTTTDSTVGAGYVENGADADYSDTVTSTTGGSYDADGGADAGADGGADGGADFESGRGTVGHDTSGPTTDDAMTRSEEQVNVGTTSREAGRARLRKYVVTENVTQTVPVSHEEVRLDREPITEGNVGNATAGPDISEEEHEVTLHAEQPVVQKETVPVERVRLGTETVTDEQTVTEEVRKEQVELEGDGTTTDRH
jgi:uncharacterized protein (TIGR02271 family)